MKNLISGSACVLLALACVIPAFAESSSAEASPANEGQIKAAAPTINQASVDEMVAAASIGDTKKVLALLQSGISPNAVGTSQTTALMAAASGGSKDTVRLLLDHGADVNVRRSTDGWSALLLGSYFGFDDVVTMLLDAGADVNEKNNYGENALFHATSMGQEGCVKILLAHGADPTPKNDKGYDALRVAQSRMYSGIAKKIEAAIAKLDKKSTTQ